MDYSDVTTQLTSNWVAGNIQLPTFKDKNLQYSLRYPHFLFIQVYESMPIEEISKDNVFKRKQLAEIYGVYSTYADAELSLKETTNCITLKKGWRLSGKSSINKKRNAFVFKLRWFELKFLKGGEW